MLNIKIENKASKFIKRLAVKSDIKRIFDKITELANNPFPQDAKRVEGYHDIKVFRVRVGNYRVLYFVDYDTKTVYIVNIDRRERVY